VSAQDAVLDQYFAPTAFGLVKGRNNFAQTFVVGVSGVLSTVSLEYDNVPAQRITYELRRVAEDGRPSVTTEDLLATGNVIARTNQWFDMDFLAASVEVRAGDRLAVTMVSCCYNVISFRAGIEGTATYPGGEAFSRGTVPPLDFSRYNFPVDLHLKTLVVPVPEPGAKIHFLSGLALVGMFRVFRRRSRVL
jgi:hypothetical protein